jgi:MFS transporter, PAT family, beta-lactamase induction signal transducer AmpG
MSESGAGGATMGFIRGFLADRRQKAMLVLGFSQGIPYLLVYATQSAWLTEANVALGTLGILSELTLAYRLKFLWAPFLERYDAPILGRLLGRRRGWMVASQLGVVLGLVGIAVGNPATQLWWTILVSVALGRHGSYFLMAAMMLPGMAAALYAPEPDPVDMPLPPDPDFFDTILGPFLELVRRLGRMAIPILIMIAGFRMPGYISNAMAIPLFKHLHYSNTDIGTVTKLVGFWIAIAGVFAAGIVVTRIGIMASLVIGTIAGSASHLALAYLAAQGGNGGHDYWTFAIAVGIDGFAASFAQIVLITYMSSISSNAFAGSQFGMLTSLVALPGSFLTMGSGFAASHLGFPLFFTMTALIGLPIALLTIWVWRVEGSRGLSAAHRAPPAHPGLTAEEAPASAPP